MWDRNQQPIDTQPEVDPFWKGGPQGRDGSRRVALAADYPPFGKLRDHLDLRYAPATPVLVSTP